MATNLTTSRRRHIPGTSVLNWQSTENQGAKPLVRRPLTACEACRTAKVKCNGKRQCERCKSRLLTCTYTTSKDSTRVRKGPPATQDQITPSTSQVPDQSFADLPHGPDSSSIGSIWDMELPEEAFNNALKEFDWVFDDSMNLDEPTQTLEANEQSLNSMDFSGYPAEMASSLPINEDHEQSPAGTPDPTGLLIQDLPFKSSGCQCRATLMFHIPTVESVIQEKPKPRLDKMFKVTGEIIKIAKSGLDGNFKISIGDYEMQLNDDSEIKAILVLNLVKQANSLLDDLSAYEHNTNPTNRKAMNRSPACLNQLNFDYVEEVATNFRKLFQLINNVFGERELDKD